MLEICQRLFDTPSIRIESCESTKVDPKRKYLFKDGKFIYDLVFPIHEEHLQADRNLHQKIGKNSACNINQLKRLTSQSFSFLCSTLNHTQLVLLERRWCKLSIDTKLDQIQARENLQILVQKILIKMAEIDGKSRKTQARSNQKKAWGNHTSPWCATHHHDAPHNTMLRESLYK